MLYTSLFFYPRWKQEGTEAAFSWDASGYYWYLPSIFIYHDLKGQSFKDSIIKRYHPTLDEFQQGTKCENGSYVMKYSSGVALMETPFFFIAHFLADPLGFPRDGFSRPYQLAVQLGGLLASLLGLWYLRKLLKLFYEDKVVALVLFLLVVGSNYLNYSSVDCGMSHCWLFTIYVFLLLNTHYFYTTLKTKYAIRVGLLVGLAILTRPTEIVAGIIPLCWGITAISRDAIQAHIIWLKQQLKPLSMAVACVFVVYAIQLIYWKYTSGHWLYYSYGDQSFSFRSPHFYDYTLSYRTGWLRYTPLFIFSVVGIYAYWKKGAGKLSVIAFFLLNYYVVSAWDIWWYGGRAMVQSYPILVLPMAALAETAMKKRSWQVIFLAFAVLFTYLNLWITYMYHGGRLYDPDHMNRAYYWHVAGRWSEPDSAKFLMGGCDLFEGKARDINLVYANNFKTETGDCYKYATDSSHKTIILNKDRQASSVYKFEMDEKRAQWIRVEAVFGARPNENASTQFILRLVDSKRDQSVNIVREGVGPIGYLLQPGERKPIGFDLKIPETHFDHVEIMFWNADSWSEISIDSLKLWTFNELK